MVFTIDHNKAQEYGTIADGTYEVFVSNVGEQFTQNGRTYIQAQLTIRNDVQQKYQNASVFHKIWSPKETNQLTSTNYQTIAKQLGVPTGTRYNSMDDFWKDLLHRTLKVTVSTKESGGYTNTNVTKFAASDIQGQLLHKDKNGALVTAVVQGSSIDIAEDDLPF
ncbi:DUF669 domain-containing protein [Aerococcaceae bacterium NML130460]|nr:DUF669 domain-containing protein [Aerococcaceae bacterium NML130460]